MSNKVIIYSDIHFENSEIGQILPTGQNSRLMDTIEVQKQIFKRAKEDDEIREIWFGGDLFEDKNDIDVTVYNPVYDLFTEFNQVCSKPITMIVGNHDMAVTKTGSPYNTIHGLSHLIHKIVKEPVPIPYHTSVTTNITFVPYFRNKNDLKKALDELKIYHDALAHCTGKRVLFLHQEIENAIFGGSDYKSKEGISVSEIGDNYYDKILCGHIHKRQEMDNGRITIIGSPIQTSWGEASDEKGYLIMDLVTLDIEFVPTDYPKLYRVSGNDEKEILSKISEIEEYNSKKGYFNHINIETENLKMQDIITSYPVKIINQEADTTIRLNTTEGMDDEELLDTYVERVVPETFELDRSRLIKTGLKLLSND